MLNNDSLSPQLVDVTGVEFLIAKQEFLSELLSAERISQIVTVVMLDQHRWYSM